MQDKLFGRLYSISHYAEGGTGSAVFLQGLYGVAACCCFIHTDTLAVLVVSVRFTITIVVSMLYEADVLVMWQSVG